MSAAITSWLGEGARPLKKDYSIASDSHFKKEKLSQCVLTVRLMESLCALAHMPPLPLFRVKSERRISSLTCTWLQNNARFR